MLKIVFLSIIVAIVVAICSDPSSPSARFNVYFWYPDNPNEKYLGTVNGLDNCGATAWSYAAAKNLGRGDGWSYICCLKTSSSECAEKHR